MSRIFLVFAGLAILSRPASRAQSPQGTLQSASAATPKFEVASINACNADMAPNARGGGGNTSSGRLNIECQTVMGLIQAAYVIFADGHTISSPMHIPISGGPAWINSDRYTINAKPESPQTEEMMNGPMMQALLEERFKLKIHRETKEVPVYALTVAGTGLRLKPFQDGSCTPVDFTKLTMSALVSRVPGVNYCRNAARRAEGIEIYDAQGTTIDEFCTLEFGRMDRPVVNRTGIAGRFDIHLEFAPGALNPDAASGPSGPSIFTAIQQQLGLKLEAARGPGEFVVIDHIERPSEN